MAESFYRKRVFLLTLEILEALERREFEKVTMLKEQLFVDACLCQPSCSNDCEKCRLICCCDSSLFISKSVLVCGISFWHGCVLSTVASSYFLSPSCNHGFLSKSLCLACFTMAKLDCHTRDVLHWTTKTIALTLVFPF